MKTYRIETIVQTDDEEALRDLVYEFTQSLNNQPRVFMYSNLGVAMSRVANKPFRRGAYHRAGTITMDG